MLHKVPGNFHLSSHDSPETAMKLMQNGYKINFTHKINHLSFGDKKEMATINYKYGGQILNELNGKDYKQQIPFGQLMMNYYLDISEEEYTDTSYSVQRKNEETGETTEEHPKFIGFPYRAMQ